MTLSYRSSLFIKHLFVVLMLCTALGQASAQTVSISGDDVCGKDKDSICEPSHFKSITGGLLTLFATVGGVILVTIIVSRIVWAAVQKFKGDAGAIKKAREDAFNSIIGFMIVLAVFGGVFLLGLKYLGTRPWATALLQFFSYGFIEHAHAAEKYLPNPLQANNAFEILLGIANLTMRFFVYPTLVALWVASGFKFVYSRGNPEGIKTAKNWILTAFLVTVVAFMMQGFIMAFQGTAAKILPATSSLEMRASKNSS